MIPNATFGAITKDGLWRNNPALVQLLGLCPLLAVSNSFVNGLGLGIATLFVLISANLVVSLIRGWLDDSTRLPAQIMVIATFVTIADLLMQTFAFEIHQRIGLFIALIVTNCILLGRAEAFASRSPIRYAIIDGTMMGLGFLFVILAMSALREILGHGTLFANMNLLFGDRAEDWTIQFGNTGFLLMLLPPGAFLTLGCLIAMKNWIESVMQTDASAEAPAPS